MSTTCASCGHVAYTDAEKANSSAALLNALRQMNDTLTNLQAEVIEGARQGSIDVRSLQ